MTLTYVLDLDIIVKIQNLCLSVHLEEGDRRTDTHKQTHTMSELLHRPLTWGVKK